MLLLIVLIVLMLLLYALFINHQDWIDHDQYERDDDLKGDFEN